MISNTHQGREDSRTPPIQCERESFIAELKALLREYDDASGGVGEYDPSTDELWDLLAKQYSGGVDCRRTSGRGPESP